MMSSLTSRTAGNTAEKKKSNQTDDEQSDVRNGETAGENKINQTDD